MVNQYRRGADFERAVRTDLQGHGYVVIRSAGSKSPVDLIAFKQGELLLIQCKLPNSDFSNAEWNGLLTLSCLVPRVTKAVLALKVEGQARPVYRRILGSLLGGERRHLGVHWNAWHPDPLAVSDDRGEE